MLDNLSLFSLGISCAILVPARHQHVGCRAHIFTGLLVLKVVESFGTGLRVVLQICVSSCLLRVQGLGFRARYLEPSEVEVLRFPFSGNVGT